jgi:hypothetical protein
MVTLASAKHLPVDPSDMYKCFQVAFLISAIAVR